jgi:hypothetical protein
MNDDFYYLLYTTLLANVPKDSRNMVNHIHHVDHWEITISGPRDGYDYAKRVNEQQGMVMSGPNKGANNYHWVERTVAQVAHVLGIEVNYELS